MQNLADTTAEIYLNEATVFMNGLLFVGKRETSRGESTSQIKPATEDKSCNFRNTTFQMSDGVSQT